MKSASRSSSCGRPCRSYKYLINNSPHLLLKIHHLNSCSSLAACVLMKLYAMSYIGVLYTKTHKSTPQKFAMFSNLLLSGEFIISSDN